MMNIEIANRLVNLRKRNGLSQEALAEKLGISRQAVSKWECAEASPDTDNLIMLARLYGVSLDELLRAEDEISIPEREESNTVAEDGKTVHHAEIAGGEMVNGSSDERNSGGTDDISESGMRRNQSAHTQNKWVKDEKQEYVHVGFEGISVKDKDGSEVHVGWDGIHVDDKKKGDNVHIDRKGVYVNGEKYDGEWFAGCHHLPMTLLIIVLYFFVGFFLGAWHPGWMLFLLIPLWHSFVGAVERRNAHAFAYPILATLCFLCAGFFFGAWHPGWVIFLTIPIYYSMVSYLTGEEDKR